MSVLSPSRRGAERRLTSSAAGSAVGRTCEAPLQPTGRLSRLLRGALLRRLGRLPAAGIGLVDADGHYRCADAESAAPADPPWLEEHALLAADEEALVRVLDPRFYRTVALSGSLGFGRAYMEGDWETNCLPTLLRRCARATAGGSVEGPWARPAALVRAWRRLLRLNTRRGSRANIHAHYDLSNDFFALFLDPSMTYSCGVYPSPQATLADAQRAKYERVAAELAIAPGDHVLEIGCGWGGFAEFAARRYGCRVTGVTISRQQYEYARRRIAAARLSDQVEILLRDYRDLRGQFDKIASIEMIEAVGHEFLPRFFGQCAALLRKEGLLLVQGITIPDQRYERYRRGVDFIQEFIFPGGCLPSLGAICRSVGCTPDLRLVRMYDFGEDYARTLLDWRRRFWEQALAIERLGFDARFRRAWDYYLCYCTAGFLERQIGVCHLLMARPDARFDGWRQPLELKGPRVQMEPSFTGPYGI